MNEQRFSLHRLSLLLALAVLLSSLVTAFHHHELYNNKLNHDDHCSLCLSSHDLKTGFLSGMAIAAIPVLLIAKTVFRQKDRMVMPFFACLSLPRAPPRS